MKVVNFTKQEIELAAKVAIASKDSNAAKWASSLAYITAEDLEICYHYISGNSKEARLIRKNIAVNKNTSTTILNKIASKSWASCLNVLHNVNCPDSVFTKAFSYIVKNKYYREDYEKSKLPKKNKEKLDNLLAVEDILT